MGLKGDTMILQHSQTPLIEKQELFREFFRENFHSGIHYPQGDLQGYDEHSLVWDSDVLSYEDKAKKAKAKLEKLGYKVAILQDSEANLFGFEGKKVLIFADDKESLDEAKDYFLFSYNYEEL